MKYKSSIKYKKIDKVQNKRNCIKNIFRLSFCGVVCFTLENPLHVALKETKMHKKNISFVSISKHPFETICLLCFTIVKLNYYNLPKTPKKTEIQNKTNCVFHKNKLRFPMKTVEYLIG